jgi:heat shock protein HtpX
MYKQIDANKRRTIFLIIGFVVFNLLVGWAFAEFTEAGYISLAIAIIISIVMALVSYYQGDKIALLAAGAKPIKKQDNPYVYRMVENLCITAGLPLPKIYIIDDPAINAFATGRNPQHASIAITTGAIQKLENEELEGVIAHELSHIKNYDILVMTIVIVLVGMVALLGDWFFRIQLWGGGSRRRSDSRSGNQIQSILLIMGLIFLIISPIIAKLIQLAISRKREYLADASAALLTRYPAGLANALEKIKQVNLQPMRHANNATAHLYISSPFGKKKQLFSKLFSTHPPIDDRIKALRAMA